MMRFALVLAVALAAVASALPPPPAVAADAGTTLVYGPNSDFPDSSVVMPFDATGARTTYFTMSWSGPQNASARWTFYDESGEVVAQVTRAILSSGGTDVVDIARFANRVYENGALVEEGPPRSLVGRRGFVVVDAGDQPELVGSWSIANTASNSAFGGSAAGFGTIGALAAAPVIAGTTFNPQSLEDSLLILVALNPAGASVTSLTDGGAPPGGTLMDVSLELRGNAGDGIIATRSLALSSSALVSSLPALFPGAVLNSSATIVAFADEGAGYADGPLDPDGDTGISIIGWYGQTLGPYGTGQGLRTLNLQ